MGKAIKRYSANWRMDVLAYYRAVLFCFCIGNADAHLKNWSLHRPEDAWRLMPLYDLVSTRLVIPAQDDADELCLTVAGRRHGFTPANFQAFAKTLGLPAAQAAAQVRVLQKAVPTWMRLIERSFLPGEMREALGVLVEGRTGRLA